MRKLYTASPHTLDITSYLRVCSQMNSLTIRCWTRSYLARSSVVLFMFIQMMEELRALHTKCLHTEKKKDPHHPPCKHFKHFPYQRRSRYQFEKENFRRGEKKVSSLLKMQLKSRVVLIWWICTLVCWTQNIS